MSSFTEDSALELCTSKPVKYLKHNRVQLSRIYPSGLRVDSTNYNPVPMWACGCQIGYFFKRNFERINEHFINFS